MNQPVPTVKSVFDQAHEITSPTERRAYLDEACAGNAELRHQVEALLQAYDAIRSGTFMQTPAVGLGHTGPYQVGPDSPREDSLFDDQTVPPHPGAQPAMHFEGPGSQIGPYRLIKELGEGGMGAVFLAEQEQPIRRQVALKIIKPGMDSDAIIARFEAERQALTMMDHPNIARVYEAGTIPSPPGGEGRGGGKGRPYFVMELVGGVPMTRFCNDNKLTVRERLELFASVCEAIQHAHAKGVMHRDIKPGNVLVARQDGKPVSKVIDFGLAKAIGQPLTDDTQLTQVGAIVGTLEYMSPEQADPSGSGVDTATDIYSLGVMLFELLTGTTPLDLARTHSGAGVLDLVMRIHTEEPPRPSDRAAALADRLPKIAEQRKIEPVRLAKLLRGELDWIALRALEKDRKRRYETASAFARDVQSYLNDEPVEACPPTVGYRVGKFVRKYRTGVVAGSFVGAMIVLVIVGLIVAVARETGLRRQEQAATERAQTTLDMTDDVFGTLIRNRPNLGENDKALLRQIMKNYQRVLAEMGAFGEEKKGEAHSRVGLIYLLLGDPVQAEANYRVAIQEYQRLVDAFPGVAKYQHGLASSSYRIAHLLSERQKWPESEAVYRRAIQLYEAVVAALPAEPTYRSALAETYYDLGAVLRELREPAKAERAFRQAIDARGRLVDWPNARAHQVMMAAMYHNLGNAIRDQGNPTDALQSYNQAARLLKTFKPRPSDVILLLRNLSWDRAIALGQRRDHGDHTRAVKQWQTANDLDERGTERPYLALFEAVDRAEATVSSQSKPAGEVLYKAALANARAKAAAMAKRETGLEVRYTRRALDLLKQAQSAGWFRDSQRIEQLKEDKSFDSLPRDDFKRFLETLDAKTGTKERPGKE